MNRSRSNTTPKIVGSLVITAIVLSGAYVFLFKNDSNSSSKPTANDTNTTQPSAASTTTTDSSNPTKYKNGTYTADTTYEVPKSSNSIQVQITLDGDVVKSASATHQFGTTDNKSLVYTQDFDSALSGQIVGRKIEDVNLNRVGGASLTTEGFNTALANILQQAKS